MTEEDFEVLQDRYIDTLKPLFFPDLEEIVKRDVIRFFASILRIVGMEDRGWDPLLESRATLEDLNAILQMDLPQDKFPNKDATAWRMGLLMYTHIIEMDSPYEVLTNLLRFRLGEGYHPNPYYTFLTEKQKKQFKKYGNLYPKDKIQIIKALSSKAGLLVGNIFDEFYNSKLRNAINHSDFILTDEDFRCRSGTGAIGAFKISLEDLNAIITKAKAFISSFFGLEQECRRYWGTHKDNAKPYDPKYKGLLEILVDNKDLMCGFKVHWPNNSESEYRRTEKGIDMINCNLDITNATIGLFVNLYARNPGGFSPLVEQGENPIYTPLANGLIPSWPNP